MNDISGQSYISTIIMPDSETVHYVKDAEARAAITTIEGKEAGWDAKQNKITASGILKGNGSGGVSAATAGTDYLAPVTAVTDDTSKTYVTKVTQTKTGQISVTKGNLPTASSSTAGIMKLGASGGADVYGAASTAEANAKAYADGLITGLGSYLTLQGAKATESEIKALTSAKKGDVWINQADNSEWVCIANISGLASASSWEKLGYNIDLSPYLKKSEAGSLAYKSSASGSFTPSGSVAMDSYTPAGSLSMNNFTPAGSISTGTGTANYTPSGTVSKPTASVTLNTTTVNSITEVGTLPSHGADSFTPASWSGSVSNETLTFSFSGGSFTQGSFSQGTLPTKGEDTAVATTVKSATVSQPTFTGTGAELKFTGTAAKPTGSFSGTAATLTGSFTGSAGTVTVS